MRNFNPYRARFTTKRTAIAVAVLMVCSLLMGCVSGTTQTQPPMVVQPSQHPTVREALLNPCDTTAAQAIPDGKMSTLLSNHVDVALALGECSASKADLVDAIRKQKGIDVVP